MQNTDAAIAQKVLGGDKKAFSELVNRHKDRAMTLALRMLRDRQDAEEAIQDAFVRAFHALPRFEWKSSFSTWFYRIVYNVCATQLSRRGDDVHVRLDSPEGEQAMETPTSQWLPDVQYESRELESIVTQEVEALPPAYSVICTLFFVNDMSYDQIVEVTGLPLGTVKVRLFRGRTMLRRSVAQRLGYVNIETE